jgi:tetratricopeptide (TPR) repeat protein
VSIANSFHPAGSGTLRALFADDARMARLGRRLGLVAVLLLLSFAAYYVYDRYHVTVESPVDRAVRALEDRVRASPNDVDLRMQVANGYIEQKRFDEAVVQYEEVLKLRDGWVPALFAEAAVEYARGNQARAEELYRRIADRYVNDQFRYATKELQVVYYRLGQLALAGGRFDEAAGRARESLIVDATNGDALYLLGQSLEALGNPAAASDAYLRATGFDPNFRLAFTALERSAIAAGNKQLAAYAQGMQQYASGDFQAMSTTFQTLVADVPDFARAYEGLGLAYAKQNKAGEAIAAFRAALERDPQLMLSRWSLHSLGVED